MAGAHTVDLDRLESRGRWLRRGFLLLFLGLALAGGVYIWRSKFGGGEQQSQQFESIPVAKGLIRATIATSGIAEANDDTDLRFATVGRVNQILVTLGQQVKSGDPLAVLESGDLRDRLSSAQANLAVAQIRLRQLVKGASNADLLAADQAVATAQATLSKGQNDLADLLLGASDADVAAAEQAVTAAQANLDAAEAKQKALVDTPSAAILAAAQAGVTSAQAAKTKAQNDLDKLLEGASDANIATAQGAVASAQASLDAANAKLAALQDAPSDADKAAAQAAVTAAQANVSAASNLVTSAQTSLQAARGSLSAVSAAYCSTASPPESCLCSSSPVPVPQSCINTLLDDYYDISNPLVDPVAQLINGVVQANNAYNAAQSSLNSAQAGLTSAQASLTAAQAKLNSLGDVPASADVLAAQAAVTAAQQGLAAANANLAELQKAADPGNVQAAQAAVAAADANLASAQAQLNNLAPSREDLTAAQAAVDAARDGVTAAQEKLDKVKEGPDSGDIQAAEDAVRAAEANVNAAIGKRDKLIEGAEPEDIDLATENVHLAQIAVGQAQRAVDEATLKAPYDGSVSAVDVQVGDFVSSQSPAITMLTPGALKLSLSVGETDLPSLNVGMVGLVNFDALPDHPFPVVVTRIGLGPKVAQGVVTYAVECAISGLEDPPAARPVPGMNGTAIIVTEQHQDVLVVPNRAIRRRGNEVVVDVMVNGKVETRPIQTGLSDTDNTEVLSGLAEGDLLALPSTTSGTATKTPEVLPEGIK